MFELPYVHVCSSCLGHMLRGLCISVGAVEQRIVNRRCLQAIGLRRMYDCPGALEESLLTTRDGLNFELE